MYKNQCKALSLVTYPSDDYDTHTIPFSIVCALKLLFVQPPKHTFLYTSCHDKDDLGLHSPCNGTDDLADMSLFICACPFSFAHAPSHAFSTSLCQQGLLWLV
jgi:hypothetical protein